MEKKLKFLKKIAKVTIIFDKIPLLGPISKKVANYYLSRFGFDLKIV